MPSLLPLHLVIYFSEEFGPLFFPNVTTAVTNRRLYCILALALEELSANRRRLRLYSGIEIAVSQWVRFMAPLPEQGKWEGRRRRWPSKTRRRSLEVVPTSECNITAGLSPQWLHLERREGQTLLRSKWLGAMVGGKASGFESSSFWGIVFP